MVYIIRKSLGRKHTAMKRKIYGQLLNWKKENNGNCALLIEGARRVGKSYIVDEFARREYKSYIMIDFFQAPQEVKELFDHYLNDLDTLFLYLQTFFNTTLYPGESVIIFDEVQMYPRARAAIKYLVADGRFHYIETGSLVSIKKNVKDIIIPSEEKHLQLNPMDFEEFLWALGDETIYPLIRHNYEKKQPMGQAIHRKIMDYFRQYLIVGGMPQVVNDYVLNRDFNRVDEVKRNILRLYREDMVKHADGNELKAEAIFDDIPSQLSRHEKKFKMSSLDKNARTRDYEDAFIWLQDARIVNHCYNSTDPSIGLKMNQQRTTFKAYMADTGLLLSHAFDEKGIVTEEIYKKILFNKLEFNEGMILENIVAQMLTAAGHKLYFYSNSSRDNCADRMEIDFLISKNVITNRHNIAPIEVKSGKNYTLNSLRKFMKKYYEQLDQPIVLHTSDLKQEDGILFLPIYMTGLL